MSKNAKGYMGVQVGKLGTAVGSIFRRRQVYRSYQPFVKNPRTPKQIAGRLKFSTLSQLSRSLAPIAAAGLGTYARTRNSYYRNEFIRINSAAVSVTTGGEINTDYSGLLVAEGNTPAVAFDRADATTPQKISVPFSRLTPASLDTDIVILAAYSPNLDMSIVSDGTPITSTTATLDLPTSFSGETVHLWGFVKNTLSEPTWNEALQTTLEPNIASYSTYIGSLTIG